MKVTVWETLRRICESSLLNSLQDLISLSDRLIIGLQNVLSVEVSRMSEATVGRQLAFANPNSWILDSHGDIITNPQSSSERRGHQTDCAWSQPFEEALSSLFLCFLDRLGKDTSDATEELRDTTRNTMHYTLTDVLRLLYLSVFLSWDILNHRVKWSCNLRDRFKAARDHISKKALDTLSDSSNELVRPLQ